MLKDIITHLKIDQHLCGRPLEIGRGFSRVAFRADTVMAVDDYTLVHGGFIFGLADYAAMIAVNDPNVVLGSAEVKFLKPVKVGENLIAEARVVEQKGKKQKVVVSVKRDTQEVFSGEFICFVLEKHVLAG